MFKKVNEKGQALVMVLFCSVIAILFIIAVLYMVTRGEQVSGAEKRYETALDGADSGVTLSVKFLDDKRLKIDDANFPALTGDLDVLYSTTDACTLQKLNTPCTTAGDCTAAWTSCNGGDMTLDAETQPDIAFTVRGTTNGALYDVSAKIVDSRRGVTGTPPGNFELGGVVNSDGAITPVNLPYFYYVVEVASRERNRDEVARLTYIYAD